MWGGTPGSVGRGPALLAGVSDGDGVDRASGAFRNDHDQRVGTAAAGPLTDCPERRLSVFGLLAAGVEEHAVPRRLRDHAQPLEPPRDLPLAGIHSEVAGVELGRDVREAE